ncbi:glycosyltransferase family 2 protein [Urechidicola croceus]|uniref:Uncharacterized protein n=1 Tax=Urechidicola croceus TaxID=1850246 RepID=A0A1D8PAY5_9FLAO|nr:cellulose synthase catalytic subunit [Urechidicola croceus]AOW21716.1 hypothetical protein LPB138_13945 [Urechidicola croceus]
MDVKAPNKLQLFTIRFLIIVGVITILNFFYWFLDSELIDNRYLYWALIVSMIYSYCRIFYEWYHYWSISVPKTPEKIKDFKVDILTTYFPGEPYEMTLKTLEAIQNITYPHTTYLCDEANDPFMIEKCKELGVIHVTRDNRIDAKAGNINNALRTKATGEICVILDPDHIPQPDFLDPIIPYFSDPEIGFVQVVQAYYNLGESFVAKGSAQQTFQFYGPMMMTMNTYGTVNAIGANCTFRREALDSIGGHAPGLSEDMHTAMQLFAKGWKSVYVPKILARGLVPSTLTAYYKQQLKWSRGTLELLVSVFPKLFMKFNWRQKIHFGLIPMHYLAGIFYLINFLIPIVSLFGATTPWKGNVLFFSIIIFPVISSIFLVRHYVQRWVMEEEERGFHIVGGLLLISTWWVYIIGLFYTLIRKKVLYLPTPKDGSDKSSWKIIAPNVVIGCLSIMAIIYGLSIDWTPFTFVMSGFAFINAFSMFFTIYFSFHTYKKLSVVDKDFRTRVSTLIYALKVRFWHFRHGVYQYARKVALPSIVLILGLSGYLLNQYNYMQWEGVKPRILKGKKVVYNNALLHNAFNDSSAINSNIEIAQKKYLNDVVGVNFKKGKNWFKDNYVLTRRVLEMDFDKMKSININTIRYQSNNVYDQNVISISKEKEINVIYSFWIPSDINFVEDQEKANQISRNILKKVYSMSAKKNIIGWNLENDVWSNMRKYYSRGDLIKQRIYFINWLRRLVDDIKKIDSNRPLILDVELNSESPYYINDLNKDKVNIDVFGLLVFNSTYLKEFSEYASQNNISFIFNDIAPENLTLIDPILKNGKSVFIRNWQDEYENDKISFDGLINRHGKFNADNYAHFNNYYNQEKLNIEFPLIKIVKPAVPLYEGRMVLYKAVYFEDNQWKYPELDPTELSFEWNLIKLDDYGYPLALKPLGKMPITRFHIPKNYENHRLNLVIKKGDFVQSKMYKLNIPLEN